MQEQSHRPHFGFVLLSLLVWLGALMYMLELWSSTYYGGLNPSQQNFVRVFVLVWALLIIGYLGVSLLLRGERRIVRKNPLLLQVGFALISLVIWAGMLVSWPLAWSYMNEYASPGMDPLDMFLVVLPFFVTGYCFFVNMLLHQKLR